MSKLLRAYGYQGDNMSLPVPNVDSAVEFYEQIMGFSILAREQEPNRVVLGRDEIRIGLVENGGDPEQDGCAFHVNGIDDLMDEFVSRGLVSDPAKIGIETRDDGSVYRVFFVVAPDGLCFWFGERQE